MERTFTRARNFGSADFVTDDAMDLLELAEDFDVDAINLVIMVCAVLSPANCEEKNLVFSSTFSLQQCAMAAPPYIAQWIGEHPQWKAVKWHCEYPHSHERI